MKYEDKFVLLRNLLVVEDGKEKKRVQTKWRVISITKIDIFSIVYLFVIN